VAIHCRAGRRGNRNIYILEVVMSDKFDAWWEKPLAPTPFNVEDYNNFKRAVATRDLRPSVPNDAGISHPDPVERMREALIEAERFMAYFAGENGGHFVGPGTPQSCLVQIRAALGTSTVSE
jgi:hypothetical protein